MKNFFYLLVHDHKHGNSFSLHSTHERARASAIEVMRDAAAEWGEDVSSYSNDDLWSYWPEISGGTEFFSVEELTLE